MRDVYAQLPPRSLVHLDLLRGLAAALVVVNHVRGLFFVDYEQLAHKSLLTKLGYLFTGMGHECVVVFFVLSGFFVGHSVIAAHRAGTFRTSSYAMRRLTRLYVVFLPGLILTALLDRLGMRLFGSGGIYAGRLPDAPYMNLPDATLNGGVGTFFANLFFLQLPPASFPVFGTNTPLWSLPFEFWFYVLFPLVVFASRKGDPLGRWFAAIAAGTLLALGGIHAVAYFAIWLSGALVAATWHRLSLPTRFPRRAALGCAALLLLGAISVARARVLTPVVRLNDLGLGVCTALAVWLILAASRRATMPSSESSAPSLGERGYASLSQWLARSSYSTYVVHYPILVFVYAAVNDRLPFVTRWQPTVMHAGVGFALFAMVLLSTQLFARLTEAHTETVRRACERSLSKRFGERQVAGGE